MSARLPGGHERQFVRGQRPDRARRHDDRDALGVALVDVAQQPSVDLRVAAGPPGGRALDAAHRTTTGRDEQCLVRPRAAIPQLQSARLVVDRDGGVGDELGAHVLGEPGQRDAIGVAEGERLRHRQGPIGEVGVRSNEGEADAIARHRAKAEERLQARHPTADDHDVHALDATPVRSGLPCGGEYGRSCVRASRSRPEVHLSHRSNWLRAGVLGANDGIVSTASLVLGVAASGASGGAIIVAGIAGLVAGALSMAAGEYVSVSSQRDAERADMRMEARELRRDPPGELRELAGIYEQRGLPPALAQRGRDVAVAPRRAASARP